jgi:hypothetical protein
MRNGLPSAQLAGVDVMQNNVVTLMKGAKRSVFAHALICGFILLASSSAFALQSVTLAWDPSPDPSVTGYNVYYGAATHTYTNKINAGNATSVVVSNLVEGATYYFVVTAYNASGLESDPSNEVTYAVPFPPVVVLTSPASGAAYLAPATINCTASVTTNGHTITRVQFYNGTTLLGQSTSAPFTYTWSGVSAGSYSLTARLTYDSGSTLDSSAVSVTVTNPLPVVALTSPANGANFTAPAAITCTASVTTNGHTITRVQFYNGTTLLGQSTSAPFTYTWSGVGAGSYSLTARLTYDSGSTLDSAPVSVSVGNPPPTIALTAPANGATYVAPASISCTAGVTANGHTITRVQFYNGTTLLGEDTAAPYAYTWSGVSAGSYSLTARLTYDSGTTLDSSAVSVTVTNPLPLVALTAPTNGATYVAPASISCTAAVTTNGHAITRVQFYNGTTLLGQSTSAPFTYTWSGVSAGSYSLTARLTYDSGSTLDSGAVSVTVTNPLPVVALTAPANGATYVAPASISCTASVTTNGHTITRVQFYNGTTLLGQSTSAPFTYTWSGVSAGSYSLTARLTYDSGSTLDSAPANVTVGSPAPTIALTAPADGATYVAPAAISCAASVTANGHTITRVQFYSGTTLLGQSTSAPFTYTWSGVGAGSYSLTARLTYDSGSILDSAPVSVTVGNPAPAIALTAPTDGDSYVAPATISCAATVTANGHTVAKVQFYDGVNLLGEATSAPYTFDWSAVSAGSYSITARIVYDGSSTIDSAPASVSVTNALPIISLTSPADGATYSAPALITLTASVTANGRVITKVQFYSDANLLGEATLPPYTFDWNCTSSAIYSLTARLIYDGTNSIDSMPVSVPVKPAPPGNVHLSTVGNGSLSPNLSVSTMTVGKTYSVTAVPGADAEFAGWSGSTNSSSPTIKFVFTPDLVLKATFVRSPFSPVLGTYNGLFFEPDQVHQLSSGSFTVSLAKHGLYTGFLQMGTQRYPFRGRFGLQCQTTNLIAGASGTLLNLQLRLGSGDEANQIFGTLSDGHWLANLSGDRARFSAMTNPAPYVGTYTFFLPGTDGDPSLPAGNGVGSVRVDPNGRVRLIATLADGAKVSQSASLSKAGLWPLYAGLYSGSGSLLSWLAFTNQASEDLVGTLNWIKPASPLGTPYPAGFVAQCLAVGSAYRPPAPGAPLFSYADASMAFAGGGLTADFTNLVSLVPGCKVANLSANKLSFSFSASTGTFRGKISDPATAQSLSFSGAVFQKQQVGYGFLLNRAASSQVILAPRTEIF